MVPSDFQIPLHQYDMFTASRAPRAVHRARASNAVAALGLRYEKRVKLQLEHHVKSGRFYKLEHNPWFNYQDPSGFHACCPDFLLWPNQECVVVVEVKYTWVPIAAHKLRELYLPVVNAALGVPVAPLVIVKALTEFAPRVSHTLRAALESESKLLQYFDNGRLVW